MAMKVEFLDELIAHGQGKSGQWMLSETGLMGELRRALAERLLRAELPHHLALEGRAQPARWGGTTATVPIFQGGFSKSLATWSADGNL